MLAGVGVEHAVRLWRVSEEDSEDDLTTLKGHGTFVWSLAFSPDGSLLASGDDDGEIKLWEVKSSKCLKTLRPAPGPIGALAFTPDGKRLLSSSSDMVVALWDVSSGYCLQKVPGQSALNWPGSISCTRDATTLANGYNDHTIKLLHIGQMSGTPAFKTFSRGGGQVWSVAFSFDGSMLASGDDEGTLALWDVQTGTLHQVLRSDRPYERMNIHGIKRLTEAQKNSLKALGAIEVT
jgi:WD40 repeat protein